MTIATLSRLRRALDRAGRARAVRRGLGMYLTEFGIQGRPIRSSACSETKQAEYRSIAERIAWRNPRVRAFSQYLMRDDLPRRARLLRYGGFESGLRHSHGKRKRAYRGFRLPLVARRQGRRGVYLWGLVRPAACAHARGDRVPQPARAQVAPPENRRHHRPRILVHHHAPAAGRRYRVRWGPHLGAPTRVYRR